MARARPDPQLLALPRRRGRRRRPRAWSRSRRRRAPNVEAAVEFALASPRPEPGAGARGRLRARRVGDRGEVVVSEQTADVRELTMARGAQRGAARGDGARPGRVRRSARTSLRWAGCSRSRRACSSRFGAQRVIDAPISEAAQAGAGGRRRARRLPARRGASDRRLRLARDGSGRQSRRQVALHVRRAE